jgi:hypothetical protein
VASTGTPEPAPEEHHVPICGAAAYIGQTPPGGVVMMPGLPTEDPLVEGQVWNQGGVLRVSAGPPGPGA